MTIQTIAVPFPAIPVELDLSSTETPTNEIDKAQTQPLYALIARQPFFKGLSATHLQFLTDSAFERQFEPGQVIITEGSPANRFFLILEGKVVMESEAKERGKINIQTLGPGDDLGWSWLFPPYAMHLTARAVEPTKTIFFFGTRLRQQCEEDHELGYQLMTRVAEVATQCVRAMQQRLKECAEPDKLQQ